MLNHPSDLPQALTGDQPDARATLFSCPAALASPAVILEKIFNWHGRMVARFPWLYILGCAILTGVCCCGLPYLQWENNIVKMWNPAESETFQNFEWLWKNHPPDNRIHSMIFVSKTGKNILTPENLRKMAEIREKFHRGVGLNGSTWQDSCLKVPVVPTKFAYMVTDLVSESAPTEPESTGSNFFDSDDDDFLNGGSNKIYDPSVELYPYPYCNIVETFSEACFEDSILELFGKEGSLSTNVFEKLSTEDILDRVNGRMISDMFLAPKDFPSFLGGVTRDENDRIVSAEATIMFFYSRMNVSDAHLQQTRDQSILGDQLSIEQIDTNTRLLEDNLIEMLLAERESLANDNATDLTLEFMLAKSFPDTINEKIVSNIPKVAGSFLIMFFYVCVSLGSLHCVENRVYLSIMGLVSVLLAMGTSYGICSALGFSFSPLHNFIPFLLLGLGVDDMFVIVQTWDLLNKEDKTMKSSVESSTGGSISFEEKFGRVLQRSGVAITVTSLTDFLAFAVGSTTSLPALRSFCLFCGVGIMTVYVYQTHWFVAWMVLDERRKSASRNAFCLCVQHKNTEHEEPHCKKLRFKKGRILETYGNYLKSPIVKGTIILATVAVLGISIYGNTQLVEEFDPWLFVPSYLYVSKWKTAQDRLFPSKGERVYIFVAGEDRLNFDKLDRLVDGLELQTDILTHIDSWYLHFRDYWEYHYRKNETTSLSMIPEDEIRSLLVRFLFSPMGTRYRYVFDVESPIRCGQTLPHIKLHLMTINHKIISNSLEGISAMNRVKNLIKGSNFKGKVFPFSPLYSIWEIDEIIRSELHRNVSLAVVSIYFATIFLLSDFKASLFVLVCVFITLTNVSGIMHFWDLKIDTVTCTVIIVCIGLSVDFSAHVVHAFMQQNGDDRNRRVTQALVAIAPAVLHGGFSTFLAVVLLSVSDVYVLKTFYKIFVLVIFFGLFNGLVFLPVLLSLLGPRPDPEMQELELALVNKPAECPNKVSESPKRSADHPESEALCA